MINLVYKTEDKKIEAMSECFYSDDEYEVYVDGEPKGEKALSELLKEEEFDDVISELNGNFAIVVLDRRYGRLYMGRDRLGTKQLYYAVKEGEIVVSDHFKPCFEAMGCRVDKTALQHYFTFQYVPEPLTIGCGVYAVKAGFYALYDRKMETVKYNVWKPEPSIKADRSDFRKEIRKALRNSVRESLKGYEKPAAFLSGGLDSSILCALAARENKNFTAYTIGFDVPGFSEAEVAARSAEYYGIKHEIIKLSAEDFKEAVPFAVQAMGVPVADPSAVAVSLIAKAAAGKCDVILSGEGSDELWGGYHVYNPRGKVLKIKALPAPVKKLIWTFASHMKDDANGKDFLRRGCVPLRERFVGNTFLFTDAEKKTLLKNFNPAVKFTDITGPYYDQAAGLTEMDQMQYIDTNLWFPGDINVVSGKGCSERGLNVAMPFTDNAVTDLARTLTKSEKLDGDQNKVILREAFRQYITEEVKDGKKKGYPVPVRVWLSGELNEWAREIVESAPVDEYINKEVAYQLLEKCKEEPQNPVYYRKAWAIVVFCVWMNQYA